MLRRRELDELHPKLSVTDPSHLRLFQGQAPIKGPNIPATRPKGGGTIETKVTVPILPGQSADVSIWATGTNKTGGESARSNQALRPIFRTELGIR